MTKTENNTQYKTIKIDKTMMTEEVVKMMQTDSETFIIPQGVTSIGDNAFYECESLESIIIPNSVKSIGNNTFGWCTNLKFINILNSVTIIGNDAFRWCKNLKSINIPNNVTSIGDGVFWLCKNLKSIDIPNSVKSIGEWAFYECENLESITFEEPCQIKDINMRMFEDTKITKDALIKELERVKRHDLALKLEM